MDHDDTISIRQQHSIRTDLKLKTRIASPSNCSMHQLPSLILLTLSVTALLGQSNDAITRLALDDGSELRILKVSLETNHLFQAISRTPWTTGYDSLVVRLEKVHPDSSSSNVTREQVEARLPDNSFVKGEDRRPRGEPTGEVEFRLFDRKAQQIYLRYHDGTNVVPFVVNNPCPTRSASWVAGPLPQTNDFSQTRFILSAVSDFRYSGSGPSDYLRITLGVRTLEGDRTGWMYWRVVGFDSSGNWSESSWGRSSRFPFLLPMLSMEDPPWKLCVEAEEYISAGFIPAPTNGGYVVCTTAGRAQSLGVIFLMAADQGSYFVQNGSVTRKIESSVYTPPSATWAGNDNWTLQVVTDRPGIVCLSEPTAGLSSIRARLRERLPDNEGRIFEVSLRKAVQFPVASNLTMGFFPVSLPPTTTNLEAEIIALHKPAEFLIDPPK